jgi:hypothetical protein
VKRVPALLAFPCAFLAAAASAPSAAAQAAPPTPDHTYEVTLVFGASVLGVEADSERPLSIDPLQILEEFLPGGQIRRLLPSGLQVHDKLGGSFLQGFQLSRRLGRRAWIETEFLIAPAHTRRRASSFRCPAEVCALLGLAGLGDALATDERVIAYHYGLSFAYELARGEVRPYLSVGPGAVTYDAGHGEGGTSFALEVAAGARLAISDHVGARVEVADRIVFDHFITGGTEHDLQVRAGASLRLP